MNWASPWFALAVVLPIALAVMLWRRERTGNELRWSALPRVAIGNSSVASVGRRQPHSRWICIAALFLTVLSLARPQWGEEAERGFSYAREVVIALDLSKSMMTADVDPSRLAAAHVLIEQLLQQLNGENAALVVFAGTAFVQVPMGPDYQIIRAFLPSLDADYLPQPGSDYGRMLDAALDAFSTTPDRDRYLFVLSDGESSASGWENRLAKLIERDIHVIGVGVGTDAGGFVPNPLEGGYLADGSGQAVRSVLTPDTLRTLANRTGGRYAPHSGLSSAEEIGNLLEDTVEQGRRGRSSVEMLAVESDKFQWLLAPAVLLALVGLFFDFAPQPKPRPVRSESPQRPQAASARVLVITVLLAGSGLFGSVRVLAHFDDDAGFEVRRVFVGDPVPRLRSIVEHLADKGYDAFDLRLMVEESIRYGVDSQRTGAEIAAGVLRDAIEATRQGEVLNPEIADWRYYRVQLSDLLRAQDRQAQEKSQAPDSIIDEENDSPMVIGDGVQQTANDSFGLGAAARSDTMLGQITPPADLAQRAGRKAKPPTNTRPNAVRQGGSSGGQSSAIMKFTREMLQEAAQADSPGRLHALMAEDVQPPDPNAMTW